MKSRCPYRWTKGTKIVFSGVFSFSSPMQFLSLLSFTSLYAFPKPVKRSAFVDNRPRAGSSGKGGVNTRLAPFFMAYLCDPMKTRRRRTGCWLWLLNQLTGTHPLLGYLTPWLGFSILRRENEMLWSRQKVKKRIFLCSHPYFPLQLGSYIPSPSSIQN